MRASTVLRVLATFVSLFPAPGASDAASPRSSPRNSVDVITKRTTGPDNAGCQALAYEFNRDHVFYEGTDVYNYENSPREFWSNTEILSPSCIFRPTSAHQIGGAVEILRKTNIKFAVRGGGHMGIKVATPSPIPQE